MNGTDAFFALVFGLSALALVASLAILLVTQHLTGRRVNWPIAVFALIFGLPGLWLIASLVILLLLEPGH